jgi:hypothetical protein
MEGLEALTHRSAFPTRGNLSIRPENRLDQPRLRTEKRVSSFFGTSQAGASSLAFR